MKAKYAGAIAIIIAASLWAIDGVFLTPTLYSLTVMAVVFALHLVGVAIISFFAYRFREELKQVTRKQWIAVFFVGLFGGVLGTYAITKAIFLVYTQGANISVILLLQKLQPIFAIGLATILLRERPTKKYFLWVLLAIIGSYFLSFGINKPTLTWTDPTTMAALFAIIAAISWGSSTSISKYAFTTTSFVSATFLRYLASTIISGAILIITGTCITLTAFTTNNWLIILIITLSTGGGAILIYYWGLSRVKASSATIYELSMPVIALFLEYVHTGKFISWAQILGAILLTASILFLIREKNAFRYISGKVSSGKKEGAQYIKIYEESIIKHVGFTPFHGTLNVKITEEIKPRVLHIIPGFVKNKISYGAVNYTKGTINGYPCALLLPQKSSHKKTLEIIADTNLRKALKLKDQTEVRVEY